MLVPDRLWSFKEEKTLRKSVKGSNDRRVLNLWIDKQIDIQIWKEKCM